MNINLELVVDEVNLVLMALSKAPLPAEMSVPLSEKIKNQALPQVQATPAPAEVVAE